MDNSTPSPNVTDFSTDAILENWTQGEVIGNLTRAMCITCYSITFIIGTVGNGLLIWIAGFKMKKTMTMIWFLNLGIADFSFCMILPFSITELALWYYWPFGRIMCKLRYFTAFLNEFANVIFLMIISIDRCICVLYPIWSRNNRTSSKAAIISVIVWFFSLALSSPYIYFTDNINDNDFSVCLATYGAYENITTYDHETFDLRHKAMVITEFLFTFLIPFAIILVCYGLIAFRVKKGRRIPRSARTLKIIIITVLCFFCCWALFFLLPLIEIAGYYIQQPIVGLLYRLANSLAFFSSCLNPIIYVFIGWDFKQIMKKSFPFLLESTFTERNYRIRKS
ncbi:formyl peptide receptor 2 [Xenopus laevis]|uniref:G-protein coupled receptors family 1 profile domain-containing protein n=2 Tax=Xenopus laevis TaxID=8355 RepID=A0A974CH56_XENLA|nr:formyl peptide receptor 2 [Xenopus laevis]OCT73298.1 hypothetical protein XELAEV_18036279mg [Xenopus laevis]